jgi:hypothetical protein
MSITTSQWIRKPQVDISFNGRLDGKTGSNDASPKLMCWFDFDFSYHRAVTKLLTYIAQTGLVINYWAFKLQLLTILQSLSNTWTHNVKHPHNKGIYTAQQTQTKLFCEQSKSSFYEVYHQDMTNLLGKRAQCMHNKASFDMYNNVRLQPKSNYTFYPLPSLAKYG